MRMHTRVLMVCMALVLSILNLAISLDGVSAMPDRNVQGVCDIANASFPNGCTNAQLKTLESSSRQAALDFFKNTLELNCWHKYLVADGITKGLVLTINTSFDVYQMACPPGEELYPYIYRTDGLRSDFKSVYPTEYHPAYDYWLQSCKMAEGCANVFEEYKKRQSLIWDKNQNAAEPEATRLLQLALKISAIPITTTTPKTTTTTIKVTTTSIKHAPASCQNGITKDFPTLVHVCKDGSWVIVWKPRTTTPPTTTTAPRRTKTTAPSSGSIKKPSSASRVKIGVGCESRASGLQSSFSGMSYSWSTWDVYSDGTTGPKFGGYGSNPPC